MSEYDYAWKKLRVAVDSFDGEGSEREQLLNALVSALGRIFPDSDLPLEIREDFEQLMKDMRHIPAIGQGYGYKTSLESLSNNEVSAAISEVRRIYDVVCRYRESA